MTGDLPRILRRCRKEKGLSLKEVARSLGVHFTTVSAWERGRSAPGYEMLQQIGALYGVTAASLLGPERPVAPPLPFRPLGPGAGDELLRALEELRLAVCVASEMGRDAEDLTARTGIFAGRLAALGRGEAIFRPTEVAALVRELGAAGESDLRRPAPGEPVSLDSLPPALRRRVQDLLETLAAYIAAGAGPDRQ